MTSPLPCPKCPHARHGVEVCDVEVAINNHVEGSIECGCPGIRNAQDVADELNVSYRQVDYWIRCEYIVAPGNGSGNLREISDSEFEVARVMVRLVHAGLTPSAASVVARRMVMGQSDSATLPNDVLIILLPERDSGGSTGN